MLILLPSRCRYHFSFVFNSATRNVRLLNFWYEKIGCGPRKINIYHFLLSTSFQYFRATNKGKVISSKDTIPISFTLTCWAFRTVFVKDLTWFHELKEQRYSSNHGRIITEAFLHLCSILCLHRAKTGFCQLKDEVVASFNRMRLDSASSHQISSLNRSYQRLLRTNKKSQGAMLQDR